MVNRDQQEKWVPLEPQVPRDVMAKLAREENQEEMVILVSLALLGGLELMAFREETDNLAMMVLQDLVDRQALQE